LAISLGNLANPEKCQYKNESYDFTCDELTTETGSKFCIFHDVNYLKDDNYEKHKEEVANRFKRKLADTLYIGHPYRKKSIC
jgi:hypothetical protein